MALIVFSSFKLNAQSYDVTSQGLPNAEFGSTHTYTAVGPDVASVTWDRILNGTIVSTTANSITITWGTTGSVGSLRAKILDSSLTQEHIVSKSITLYTPLSTPATPQIISSSCGGASINAPGAPSSGNIAWYWQGTSPNGTSTSNNATSDYAVTTTGTYYLRAYDSVLEVWSNGFSSVYVPVDQEIGAVSLTGISSRCMAGGFSTFNASATNASGFTWEVSPSNAGTFDVNGRINWIANFVGTATITATAIPSSGFCGAPYATKTVVVNSLPAMPPTPTEANNCGNTVLTRSNPPSGVTYYWQSSASGTVANSTTDNATVTLTSGTTYYLRARNNTTQCWGPARTINYTVKAIPATPPVPTVTEGCGTNIITRGNPPSGVVWYWQTSATGTSTNDSSPTTTKTTGSVFLRPLSNNGCWGTAVVKVVSAVSAILPPPQPTITNNCGNTVLTRATPPAGFKYYWQSSASGMLMNKSEISLTRTIAGPYYLRTYKEATQCWGPAITINYTINAIPAMPPAPTEANNCGNTVLTRSNPPSGVTYYWQSSASGTVANSTTDNATVTLTSGTTYFLRARHNTTQCWGPARTITYSVNAVPSMPPAPTEANNCDNTVLTRATPPSGITYYWQSTSNGTVANSSTDNASITLTSGNTYYLRARNNSTLCWGPARTVTYSITTGPAAPATPSITQGDGTATLTRTAPPSGVTWYWQGTNANGTETSNSNTTYTVTADGTYYIRGLKSNGCWGPSKGVLVYTIVDPEIVPGSHVFCKLGEEVTLSVATTYSSYVWKKDGVTVGTGSTYVATETGSYTVLVTAANGLSSTSDAALITGSNTLSLGNYNYVVSTSILAEGKTEESHIEGLSIGERSVSVQYLDGLGRPWQNVSLEASPQKGHIVQPFVYDELGRQTKQYLPYVSNGCGIFQPNPIGVNEADYVNSPQYQFYQSASKVAHDTSPFALSILEPSPLNRALKQGAPGSVWQPVEGSTTDHVVRSNYSTNTLADEVQSFKVKDNSATYASNNGFYDPATLFKTSSFDEDQNEVIEFTNKSGQVVLKRVATGIVATPWAETYYIYDDRGNLKVVLPPEAVQNIETDVAPTGYTLVKQDLVVTNANYSGGSYMYFRGAKVTFSPDVVISPDTKVVPYQLSEELLDKWAFQYKYDHYNRMSEKKVPGAGWVYLLYDRIDRVIATQDVVQRTDNGDITVSFSKYDSLGRIVLTGILTNAFAFESAASNQVALDGLLPNYEVYEKISKASGNILGYTRGAIPNNNNADLYETATYYDDYKNFPTDFNFTFVDDFGVGGEVEDIYNHDVKGQVVGTQTKLLDGSNVWLKSINYYDDRYRVIQIQTENRLGGIDRVSFKYDFSGRVKETKTFHDDGTPGSDIVVVEEFTYDHASRLLQASHKVGGDPKIILVDNEYNELGELIDKRLHSADNGLNFEQSVDYQYNIRGWLTFINKPVLNDGEGDYFGMKLIYDKSTNLGNTGMYNGNISLISWSNYSAGNIQRDAYVFDYDRMNRLTAADYWQRKSGTSWIDKAEFEVENLSYDLNGNIESLERFHTNTSTAMDDLTYAYAGNQLMAVTDNGNVTEGFKDGNTGSDDYAYDENGNMISDANKDITAITYNHLNLPETITFTNNRTISYVYDAAGTKLAKIVHGNDGITITEYVGGFIYENGVLQQFAHAEGRVRRKATGDFVYDYYLKDHLGNTRITFSADKPETTYRATMENELSTDEENYFLNIGSLREVSTAANKTGSDANVTGNEVVRLNGSDANRRLGPGKMLEVTAGDKVDLEVYAYYSGTPGNNSPIADLAFATLIGNAFGGNASGTESEQAIQSGFENNLAEAVPSSNTTSNSDIKAYLNYILFNGDFGVVDAGFVRVDQGTIEGNHRLLQMNDIAIEQSGFLYVYVSNEGNVNFNVYFDELEITHKSGGILQEDHYYPFGMNIDALSSIAPLEKQNQFKFNGGVEFNTDFDFNTYETLFRGYDPVLGRFMQIDPLTELMPGINSYQFGFNNPVSLNDPLGLAPCDSFDRSTRGGRRNCRAARKERRNRRPGTSYKAKTRRLLRIAQLRNHRKSKGANVVMRKPKKVHPGGLRPLEPISFRPPLSQVPTLKPRPEPPSPPSDPPYEEPEEEPEEKPNPLIGTFSDYDDTIFEGGTDSWLSSSAIEDLDEEIKKIVNNLINDPNLGVIIDIGTEALNASQKPVLENSKTYGTVLNSRSRIIRNIIVNKLKRKGIGTRRSRNGRVRINRVLWGTKNSIRFTYF